MAASAPARAMVFFVFVAVSVFSSGERTVTTVGSVVDPVNNKPGGGGLYWATAKGDRSSASELEQLEEESSPSASASMEDEFEGGFSSLDSMLQWAIGNSDPAKLKEAAQYAHTFSAHDLNKRQSQIKELMEQLKMPSDADLMQIAIAELKNSSLSLEDHRRALEEILNLVEMIDNANNLNKFGGLAVVIQELTNSDQEVRITSAWILGIASQNNLLVQKQILELGALEKLIKMVKSSSTEEATKALYAVSALIRNNIDGQELFYSQEGNSMLQDLMSNSSADIRLRKKSAFLVADLADCQLENKNKAVPLLSNRFFLKSVVDLTESTDLDLQEKALMAIRSLLRLNTTEALDFRDFCHLDRVLERMREQLQQSMRVEYQRDFVQDLEILRREVESIFQRKLEKVTRVST